MKKDKCPLCDEEQPAHLCESCAKYVCQNCFNFEEDVCLEHQEGGQ